MGGRFHRGWLVWGRWLADVIVGGLCGIRWVAGFIVGACVGRRCLVGVGGPEALSSLLCAGAGLGELRGMLEQVAKDAAGVSQRKSLADWMTGLERSRFLFVLS